MEASISVTLTLMWVLWSAIFYKIQASIPNSYFKGRNFREQKLSSTAKTRNFLERNSRFDVMETLFTELTLANYCTKIFTWKNFHDSILSLFVFNRSHSESVSKHFLHTRLQILQVKSAVEEFVFSRVKDCVFACKKFCVLKVSAGDSFCP